MGNKNREKGKLLTNVLIMRVKHFQKTGQHDEVEKIVSAMLETAQGKMTEEQVRSVLGAPKQVTVSEG
jgi:hypothetical protein